MIKINHITAIVLLAIASLAHAETTEKVPGDQGISSVNKNLVKNPENKGLQNAAEQLEKNRIKHIEQSEKRTEKQERHMNMETERVELRAQNRDTVTRPGKVERPGK